MLYKATGNRWLEAPGGDAGGGGEGGGVQEGVPLHLRLGDQRQAALRVRLQRGQCAKCKTQVISVTQRPRQSV